MSHGQTAHYPIFTRWLHQIFALVAADMRKLRHDPSELFARMVQPVIWILIFGQAMAKTKAIAIGHGSYLDYMVPGILVQSILLVAIFHGIFLIWERDAGSLHKTLVTPTPRSLIIIGRSIAAGIRGTFPSDRCLSLGFATACRLAHFLSKLLARHCNRIALWGSIFYFFLSVSILS